ncbi:MAG: hypothetical protein MUF54_15480 [Polyangiaceae bacterium]|nr:hypothetical protein [Polyangiaceae bacterium]
MLEPLYLPHPSCLFARSMVARLHGKYWKRALQWESAIQMQYLHDFLAAIEWWRLEPAHELVKSESGTAVGYVLYTHRAGAATATIDAADQMDHCIEVKAFHNTILQPLGPPEARGTVGCAEGLNQSGGPELLSVVSRNNILHVRHKDGYWNVSGKPVVFGRKSLAEWQATGQDKDSLIADPLFMDPTKGDFRLRHGSPAARIGFKPWDLSPVGPRSVGAK